MPTVRSTGEFAYRVDGLDDFRKELRELGNQWPRALGKASQEAGEVVAGAARRNAQALGGVHALVAPSIKAAAQARQAVVKGGGDRWPMFFGAEFGAKRFSQFPPWRGNQWQPDAGGVGYMIHPAARETASEFMDVYDSAIARVAREAFPN